MAENPRTTAARDNDDSDIIEAAADLPTPGHSNASGHGIAADVASQAELAAVTDPESRVRPQKDDDIHHDQRRASGKPRDMTG
ncbi:hypothetical protein [Sphingomonas lenta]|uniref:Uncharacterized protein n=1 Tax=Sphingomonas lenta TaxID=1141887 RepID=A0A2A2SGT1_9SPHN|nr:hypothetical protein [Sphingomonas lenta]PAX08449.1 hypothetical protein CKY28_03390 [Sphingomonas lenta]